MLFKYAACHFVIVKWLKKYETGKNELNTQEDKHQFINVVLAKRAKLFCTYSMYVADNKFQLSFISSWYTLAEAQEDISDRIAEVEDELTCEEFGGADPTDADENLGIVWHKIVGNSLL